jgi:hypothetical protein
MIPRVVEYHPHGLERYAGRPELEGHLDEGTLLVQVLERV